MFSDFKTLLSKSVRRSGAASYVDEKSIFSILSDSLAEIFDKKVEENFKILEFDSGVVSIACLSEDDAQNVKNIERLLIDKTNEKLDKTLIREINVIT